MCLAHCASSAIPRGLAFRSRALRLLVLKGVRFQDTSPSLFFSKTRMMVLSGAANRAILLSVMEFKRYSFTSRCCAYAAVASVIHSCLVLENPRRSAFSLCLGGAR